jgi:hypothetical protein
MNASKMTRTVLVVLAIAAGLMAFAPAARADYWQYSGYDGYGNYRAGDTFYRAVDGFWYETRNGALINSFRQVRSTDGSILLENTVNGCPIWIYRNATYIEAPVGTGKRYYAPGQYYRR